MPFQGLLRFSIVDFTSLRSLRLGRFATGTGTTHVS